MNVEQVMASAETLCRHKSHPIAYLKCMIILTSSHTNHVCIAFICDVIASIGALMVPILGFKMTVSGDLFVQKS